MAQPNLSGEQILSIREALNMNCVEFATICGRSSGHIHSDPKKHRGALRNEVHKWEEGKDPGGPPKRAMLWALVSAEVIDPGDADQIFECLLDPQWNGELPTGFV